MVELVVVELAAHLRQQAMEVQVVMVWQILDQVVAVGDNQRY